METKTPEEKSLELIEKFRKHSKIDAGTIVVTRTESAKQFAIICVQEILDVRYNCPVGYNTDIKEYWQSVLTAIKNTK